MRETCLFFLYLFAALVLGALFTYPLMQTGWLDYEPHRVMGRLAQVFILLGLWPFLKLMRLDDREALGYGTSLRRFLRALWQGWLLGVVILLLPVSSLLWLEVRVPTISADGWPVDLLEKSVEVLVGGLLVGLLEETFFRGALYSAIRRRGGAPSAILWSSFLFALLHFAKPHALPEAVAFDWAGAWQMFLHAFTGVFQWKHLDSLAALFLVGVVLALVRERSGHIGWCVGLHAGWVFLIQLTRHLTDIYRPSPNAWLVGDFDGVIGWLVVTWIGFLTLGFWSLGRISADPRQ